MVNKIELERRVMMNKIGRPKSEITKNKRVTIRVTAKEYEELLKEVIKNKTTISEYLRDIVVKNFKK